MNKFYKTSYGKTSSINQIIKNKKQLKKQTYRKQDLLLTYAAGFKQSNQTKIKPILQNSNDIKLSNQIKQSHYQVNEMKTRQKFHLDNKIQIDHELLFKNKKQKPVNNHNQPNFSVSKTDKNSLLQKISKRKQQNKTQSQFYEHQQKNVIRPHTKQQSRNRLLSTNSQMKYEILRPQTSKGTRKNNLKQRLITLQDDNQIDIIISRNRKLQQQKKPTISSQQNKQKRKYNFQTSIDEQFLSLFAN